MATMKTTSPSQKQDRVSAQAKSKPKKPALGFGIAACSVVMNDDGEIQLTPAGAFRGIDGRPKDAKNWVMDARAAAEVIAFCSARENDFVIDYEHQTLLTEKNGQPAPAAGWFSGAALRWSEGEGLFAKVRWTANAQAFIDGEEYKYISPVILYEAGTGRVRGIHSAALTNYACIDGMDDVLSRAAASYSLNPETTTQESLTMDMEELLERLRYLLNLPTLTTPEQVAIELQKAVDLIKTSDPVATAAASFSITGLLADKDVQIAALKGAVPDPAKYVPVDAMQALQTELAALRGEKVARDVDAVVVAALSAGKLLPPQEKWARDLGSKDLDALNQYLDTATQVAALTGTQTGGKAPEGAAPGALDDAELAMCRSMGVSPEDFQKTKALQAV